MKRSNQFGNIFILISLGVTLLVSLLLSIIYFYRISTKQTSKYKSEITIDNQFQQNVKPTPSQSNDKTQIYTSKDLKISFNPPLGYSIEDKFNAIIISRDKQQITIIKSAAISNNIKKHIEDLSKKNNLKYSQLINKTINNQPFIETTLTSNLSPEKEELSLFTIKNGNIYTISTLNKELYPELELIMKSFKFTE